MCGRLIFFIYFIMLYCCSALPLEGQTPVESVISKYKDMKGARNLAVSGGKMAVARRLLKSTPVAPIASDVKSLAVLKMDNVDEQDRSFFESDLRTALEAYLYYGQQQVKKGLVDVYVMLSGQDKVSELVIYNPAIFSLNSLSGDFSVCELMELTVSGTE